MLPRGLARRSLLGLLFVAPAVGVGACRDVTLALGATAAEARQVGDALFAALAARFGPHEFDPAVARFRPRVARAALVPSWVFDEPALWPRHEGESRVAWYAGQPTSGGRYRLAFAAADGQATRAGEYRGRLRLRRLGPGEFEWEMHDELAVGPLRAEAGARSLTRLFEALEAGEPAHAGQVLAAALPRTGRALGRAFTRDALHLAPHPRGGRDLVLIAHLRPEKLAAAGFEHYARWVSKYVVPLRLRLGVAEPGGARFWDLSLHDGRLIVHLRLVGGALAPLAGAPRRLPASGLELHVDASADAGLARVGLARLVGDLSLVREPRRKAFEAVFRSAPDWQLPFLVQPLLRSSLRRPFEGQGALLAFALDDDRGAGSALLTRHYRMAVRESWLMRWLGGLSGAAVLAFRRDAEEQADRFVFEALDGLRQDVLAWLGG